MAVRLWGACGHGPSGDGQGNLSGVEGWEKQVRKYATTLTVKLSSVSPYDLGYRAIDRVELKAGGAHILINPIPFSLNEPVARLRMCLDRPWKVNYVSFEATVSLL